MSPAVGIGSEFGLTARSGYNRFVGNRRSTDFPVTWDSGTVFTSNGRAALLLAAQAVRQQGASHADSVLLPAYLCHSMVQPFQDLGFHVHFYPVDAQLHIDSDELLERVSERTVAVMLMHYFGWPQAESLVELLREAFPQLAVIDDRTHLLLSDLATTTTPDCRTISVYSPRKWGPFPDLGLILWPEQMQQAPERLAVDWPFALLRLWGSILRSLFFLWPKDRLRQWSLGPFRKAESLLDQRIHTGRASWISRLLWRHWDWAKAWRVRRDNSKYLLDNWPSVSLRPLFAQLGPQVCPVGIPMYTEYRDRVKQHLIANQVFPPIHWLQPPAVPASDFPAAAVLARQELTIPIDQRYDTGDMDHILEVVCRL